MSLILTYSSDFQYSIPDDGMARVPICPLTAAAKLGQCRGMMTNSTATLLLLTRLDS